jgi:ankyrin repeat protein
MARVFQGEKGTHAPSLCKNPPTPRSTKQLFDSPQVTCDSFLFHIFLSFAEHPTMFQIGCRVRLTGLVAAQQHNGKSGTLSSALDELTGRLVVTLDEGGSLKIKPCNLLPMHQFDSDIPMQIKSESKAAPSPSTAPAPAAGGGALAAAFSGGFTQLHRSPVSAATAAGVGISAAPRATPRTETARIGKFDTFVMPSGKMDDFRKGLSSRIGFPHLEFFKTMEAEHCSMAGCDMQFTTRNYGITTTAQAEWGIVVRGQAPPPNHMLHGRVTALVEDKLQCAQARKAKLRREEVIAVILYTGPMYMIYNCVLAHWSSPPTMWNTLNRGNNHFTTTMSVLVSAVQKLSAVTVISDGLRLYRGTGGLVYLPEHFTKPDEFNCKGMTEWGFMSCSADRNIALQYSGVVEGKPHAMVLEIEHSCVDRGAVVSEFSQYPGEDETLFLPMSYVAQSGVQRVERTANGDVTIVPVHVHVNLKAECLEQLEEKKKSIHLTGFEFRVNELRQKLQVEARASDAEERLKRNRDKQGMNWKKAHSVEGYIDALVSKVKAVLARHRARAAADYSDDAVYRSLVSESLEAARMATSALQWWLRDDDICIDVIEHYSLLLSQRHFESFLRLRYSRAADVDSHRGAALQLCTGRNLMRVNPNERDDNEEMRLIALAAGGGSVEDVALLVAAGADVAAVAEYDRSAMWSAAVQGHADVIQALVHAGASCNQTDCFGETPLWIASMSGHLRCVEVLLLQNTDIDKAMRDGSTPLFAASQYGHSSIVNALLRNGAHVNMPNQDGATPLFIASQSGRSDVVDALLHANADVDKASVSNRATPLLQASQNGHSNVADALLRAGADVNRTDAMGVTPLFMASQQGFGDVVDVLLRANADVDTASKNGATPLLQASSTGKINVVEMLLRRGANANMADQDGATPVFVASQNGHLNVVDALLDRGSCVDVNKTDSNGITPIWVACQNGHSNVVDALVRACADANKAATDGATPLFVACLQGHNACVESLVRARADLNLTRQGATPLFVACQQGREACIQILVAARADLTLAYQGWTPLAIASAKGHSGIVSILQAAAVAGRQADRI